MPDWRLLRHGPASGAWNMGVDEALLASAQAGQATLRFYTWSGAWLSLGHSQEAPPALIRDCRAVGVNLVRRVTGGRAVLHGCDLTYSVAAPESHLACGLQESYQLLGTALLDALTSLGVAAQAADAPVGGPGASGFDCFEAAASGEICVSGRKLTGNAQRRSRGAFLQHGSIRMTTDRPERSEAAGLAPGAATSLAEVGCEASEAELQIAVQRAVAAALDVCLTPGALSDLERDQATQRARDHARSPLSSPQPTR